MPPYSRHIGKLGYKPKCSTTPGLPERLKKESYQGVRWLLDQEPLLKVNITAKKRTQRARGRPGAGAHDVPIRTADLERHVRFGRGATVDDTILFQERLQRVPRITRPILFRYIGPDGMVYRAQIGTVSWLSFRRGHGNAKLYDARVEIPDTSEGCRRLGAAARHFLENPGPTQLRLRL